ncbi:MAG: hypothetical protein AAGA75_08915 [Cyanobacteria bacterium P01_E01_bin.6]
MSWTLIREKMSTLINSILNQPAERYKSEIAEIRKLLFNEQIEYAETVGKYIQLVGTYYSTIQQQGNPLFNPTNPAENLQFYDELVMHSMVVGKYSLLHTWGVDTLVNQHVQQILGRPRQFYIDAFMTKASQDPKTAKNYYLYLISKFQNTLID